MEYIGIILSIYRFKNIYPCHMRIDLYKILVFVRFLARRYDMSEKVDKGIESCDWKLSYRRKFIRTLWTIPVSIIMIIQLHWKYQSYIFTGIFFNQLYFFRNFTAAFATDFLVECDWLFANSIILSWWLETVKY